MNSDHIACFIDAQGFTDKKEFIPREIAFVSDSMKLCFECETGLESFDITRRYQFFNVHGLTLSPNEKELTIKKEEVKNFIKFVVNMYTSKEKPLVATKNHQLEELLSEIGVAFLSLDRVLFIPPINQSISSREVSCKNHFFETKNCALAKSAFYWKQI